MFGRANYLKPYLEELRQLFSFGVAERDILSLNDSEAILELKGKKQRILISKCVLPFSDRDKAKQILQAYDFLIAAPYYLWVDYSEKCGLVKIPSLESFHWNFDWGIDSNGIFSFTDLSLKREIVLDFYEDDGRKLLCVTLSSLE